MAAQEFVTVGEFERWLEQDRVRWLALMGNQTTLASQLKEIQLDLATLTTRLEPILQHCATLVAGDSGGGVPAGASSKFPPWYILFGLPAAGAAIIKLIEAITTYFQSIAQ